MSAFVVNTYLYIFGAHPGLKFSYVELEKDF